MRSQATGNLLIRDLAPAFAAVGGEAVGALRRRQPPLLPQPHDGGLQVRLARRRRGRGLERRVADGAQRDRHGAAARRAARPLVHRARGAGAGHAAARGALGRRRGARHRRLGGDRVHRPRRHGARRRARRGGVLRRRRRRRRRPHRADGADLRQPAPGASRSPRATTRAPASGSTRGSWPSSASRRRSPPACCTRARARARSAPASRTSRSSRSGQRCSRSTRRSGRDRGRPQLHRAAVPRASPCRRRPGSTRTRCGQWLIGRRVYRRTEFIVAARDGEHAVVQVEHPVGDDILAPVTRPARAGAAGRGRVRRRRVGRHRQRVPDGARRARGRARDGRAGPLRARELHRRAGAGARAGARGRPAGAAEAAGDGALGASTTTRTCRPSSSTSRAIDLRDLAAGSGPFMYPCRCSGLEGEFLDAGPPELGDWTLVGCERSRQIHLALYGAEPRRAGRLLPARAGRRGRADADEVLPVRARRAARRARAWSCRGARRSRRCARRCGSCAR